MTGNRPNNHSQIFISHSHHDRTAATIICDYLELQGLTCWLAPRKINMVAGDYYAETITNAIKNCRVFIVLLTAHANIAPMVISEVEQTFDNHKPIITVRLYNIQPGNALKGFLKAKHWFDVFPGFPGPHLDDLLRDCNIHLNNPEKRPRAVPLAKRLKWWYLMNRRTVWVLTIILLLGIAVYGWLHKNPPGIVSVRMLNTTPNIELPFEKGRVTLFCGKNPSPPKDIYPEEPVTFTDIPPGYTSKNIRLRFEAPGFETIDTTLPFPDKTVVLPIRNDGHYSMVKGQIINTTGMPVPGVLMKIKDLTALTDSTGYFEIHIPFEKQQKKQWLYGYKNGYRVIQDTAPYTVNKNQLYEIVIKK